MSSLHRRSSLGLVYIGDLLEVFSTHQNFKSFFSTQKTYVGFLYTEDLPEVFSIHIIIQRSSLPRRPSVHRLFLLKRLVFSIQKNFCRSFLHRRPSIGLLYTKDLAEVFTTPQTFQRSFLHKRYSEGIFYTEDKQKVSIKKTVQMSSRHRRPFIDLFHTFQRSFLHKGYYVGLFCTKDLPEVFSTQKILQRFSPLRRHLYRRPSIDLLQG